MSIAEQYTPEEASITTVMIAHQAKWALDKLVVLDSRSPRQISFRDLKRELERMNLGRKMRGTHVDQSLRVLSIARLCAVERQGNPPVINVASTELGGVSLTAYKAYEELIMNSYIDYSAKAMEDRMDAKEAERFARSLTIGSLGKELNLGRVYKLQEEDFEDFKSRRGFYRLPIALKALNAHQHLRYCTYYIVFLRDTHRQSFYPHYIKSLMF